MTNNEGGICWVRQCCRAGHRAVWSRGLVGVVACCCLLSLVMSCDRATGKPLPTSDEELAREYVGVVLELEEARKASDVKRIDQLRKRQNKLAQRMVSRGLPSKLPR